jgi:hypothetical protein
VPPAVGCARCDEPATTVMVEFSAMTAYVDLCEQHLGDLLLGARPVGRDDPSTHRSDTRELDETKAPS